MYLVDTNIIRYFRDGNTSVFEKFEQNEDRIFMCAIVHSECLFGVQRSKNEKLEKFYETLFDKYKYFVYGKNESKNYAIIKSNLHKSGKNVEDFDIMIASIAIANNLTMVTNNTKDFANIPDLKVVDWSK